jgi:hypothetical protein
MHYEEVQGRCIMVCGLRLDASLHGERRAIAKVMCKNYTLLLEGGQHFLHVTPCSRHGRVSNWKDKPRHTSHGAGGVHQVFGTPSSLIGWRDVEVLFDPLHPGYLKLRAQKWRLSADARPSPFPPSPPAPTHSHNQPHSTSQIDTRDAQTSNCLLPAW